MAKRILTTLAFGIFLTLVNAQTQTIQLYNPFRIDIDPMDRLLLVNIENDPDSVYIGFEPQVFDDAVNGIGHLVIAWRTDGKVDVYHQPGLKVIPEKYNITGKGLGQMIERDMPDAYFIINEYGVQAQYDFLDLHERLISFKISENNPKRRKPFGLLAPMGSAAENPTTLPLVYLHDFYFVREKHTVISIAIEGKEHMPDKLPIKMDGTRMYFARYSPEPLIATLNPAQNDVLTPISIEKHSTSFADGSYHYKLRWENETPFIESIERHNEKHPVRISFNPSFPDVMSIPDNSHLKGKFIIEAHRSTGTIRGFYTVSKNANEINISLHPSKGWNPRPNKFSLRFLYTVARVFKKWPATYLWTAKIYQDEKHDIIMESGWKRINKR